MKKKALKLQKLSFTKETISVLQTNKVVGGSLPSCGPSGCGTCEVTICAQCQSANCPSMDTHCPGCGIG